MGADQEQGGRGGRRSGDYLEGGSAKSRRQKWRKGGLPCGRAGAEWKEAV